MHSDNPRPVLCLIGLCCIVAASCQKLKAETESATVTPSPTTPQLTSAATTPPQGSDLRLLFSPTVTIDEKFALEVVNEGHTTYVHYGQSGGKCLGIFDSSGNGMRIAPDLTCDALEERVIEPGKRIFIDTWDLKQCIDAACLHREPVAPGAYRVVEMFYPFSPENGSLDVENTVTLEGSFVIRPANE